MNFEELRAQHIENGKFADVRQFDNAPAPSKRATVDRDQYSQSQIDEMLTNGFGLYDVRRNRGEGRQLLAAALLALNTDIDSTTTEWVGNKLLVTMSHNGGSDSSPLLKGERILVDFISYDR